MVHKYRRATRAALAPGSNVNSTIYPFSAIVRRTRILPPDMNPLS